MATQAIDAPAAGISVVLDHVSWSTYASLLADHIDRSIPHFTYDRGVLEIVVPSNGHDETNLKLASIVDLVCIEYGIEMRSLGSTTFQREDLERGFETDSSFYFQHEAQVRDQPKIDLNVDPPPDMLVEIDVTDSSIDKLPIYAAIGIPEVWRYAAEHLTILSLDPAMAEYRATNASVALPLLTAERLTAFIEQSRSMPRTAWLHLVRDWIRSQSS